MSVTPSPRPGSPGASLTAISDSSPVMTANLKVVCFDRFKVLRDKTSDKLAIQRELPDIRRAEVDDAVAYLEARVAALEAMLGGGAPFIEEELRPDLGGSALSEEVDLDALRQRLAGGDPAAKSEFDTKPPEG